MKKALLFLGLLSFAGSAHAQLGPWVRVNTTNYQTFAPGYRVDHIATVSANQAWAVTREATTGSTPNTFLRTNNAAGTEFDFNAITAPGANAAYSTANISPCGNSITTAIAGNFGNPGGGEILRTTDGGNTWTKVLTFANTTQSFLDFVYMFDANRGVAMGDPSNGYFEIYTTSNGGVNWTRVPQANIPPLQNTREYGLVHSFFGMSNGTVWFGGASSDETDPVRVFKSTNYGLNWTASPNTTLTGTISRLAFKANGQDGIAFNTKYNAGNTAITSVNIIKTTNGGATWTAAPYTNTATGSFFGYDIDAVNGNFYSVGQRFPTTSTAADFGTSYSADGITWTNLNNSQGFFALDLIPSGATDAVGYAGASTDAAGIGGMFKTASILTPLAARNAALQNTLSVYPNPSTSGVFNVELGSDLQAGATLTVSDALGRTVKTQTLNAAAIGARKLNLDLSGEKTGVYTLQIRTESGIATQKVVIE